MKGTNEYHVTAYDGGGTTGWAHFCVDFRAFSRPESRVLRWLKWWDCGELTGPEHKQYQAATNHVTNVVSASGLGGSYLFYDVIAEDFDLVQLKGAKENLLSPVRFNAVMAWECQKVAVKFHLQARQMRTLITPDYLATAGFQSPFRRTGKWGTSGKGKDAFAAMQHGITWLKRVKADSRRRPWKLSDNGIINARWDCACEDKKPCDMLHPRTKF